MRRADYPKLFEAAKENMVSESGWSGSPEKYSSGDGSTTFRLPRIASSMTGAIVTVKSA